MLAHIRNHLAAGFPTGVSALGVVVPEDDQVFLILVAEVIPCMLTILVQELVFTEMVLVHDIIGLCVKL